jgi:acyl transferase domain-containing protein
MLADRVPLTRMPDYGDIQSRDPEDRVPNTTVGIGRAMLSNRLSHFLDVKGPR